MDSGFSWTPESPAAARRLVRSVLSGVSTEALANAELLTSELVSNAFVHGHGDPVLELSFDAMNIRVAVSDLGQRTDLVPLAVDPHWEHGRGLHIVDAVASVWGIEPRPIGKAVWFELRLGP